MSEKSNLNGLTENYKYLLYILLTKENFLLNIGDIPKYYNNSLKLSDLRPIVLTKSENEKKKPENESIKEESDYGRK